MMLTPVPWKVLDDAAIWTQNWPWIPVPSKGESTTRFTTCTLCPAGCGIRARCVGGQPVSLAGVAGHPLSNGSVCPVALGAHHLPYHPCRMTQPLRRTRKSGAAESRPITLDEATHAIADAIKSASAGESVALLDQRPGRIVSLCYRRFFAHLPHGLYLRGPMVEDGTLSMCASMLGIHGAPLGFDLENARTIVSFGAPLFDGWGTPGRMLKVAEGRRKNGRPSIFQVETRQSRTALQADTWIPIKPGTEGIFALGLAHCLVRERQCDVSRLGSAASDFRDVLTHFGPERVAAITGVCVERISSVARTMAMETPTVVLGAGDPAGGPLRPEDNFAITSLNFLLECVGQKGGIVARRNRSAGADYEPETVPARQIQDVPNRSIRVLLLDGAESGHALPWSLIERKLADEKSLVVSFSPYLAGLAHHAEIIIPGPAFLESWQDVPAPSHSAVETFSLSAPLLAPPPGATEPLEIAKKIASALGVTLDGEGISFPDYLKAHVQRLYSSGSGSIFTPSDRRTTPLKELDSSEKFWEALAAGACWVDDKANPAPLPNSSSLASSGMTAHQLINLAEGQDRQELAPGVGISLSVMPFGWRGAAGSGQVSPLMSKVYQESGLRSISGLALINPETGKALGLSENEMATVATQAGSLQVLVRYDASVMPDVLHVAVGPDGAAINSGKTGDPSELLSMCLAEDGRSWRVARATQVTRRTA